MPMDFCSTECTYEFMEQKHGQIFCKYNSGRPDILKYAWQKQDRIPGGGGRGRGGAGAGEVKRIQV
jgi:hypothetical protein